jgi:lipid II:glycine glycyltransferase (peptidoglycan interpeptide bridge formation enzyme)
MQIQFFKPTAENKKRWEEFNLSTLDPSFLQSWSWGTFHEAMGNKIFRLAFLEKGKLRGIAQVIKEEAKSGRHFLCPAGPVIDFKNKNLFSGFINTIKKLSKKEKVVYLRIRPQILDDPNQRKFLKENGFVSAPLHLHAENTWKLDLSPSLEEILKNMRKTTRYLIRKAEKEGVVIEPSINPKEAKTLYKLQMETVQRQKFVPFSKEFFYQLSKAFLSTKNLIFFKARYRHKTQAIAMFMLYGKEVTYHYSGSSNEFPKIPSSYAMLWEAIKMAKQKGFQYFNFWGIAPEGIKNHRFSGVTTFKTGFGGNRVDYLHAHDLPLSSLYGLVYLFGLIRKKVRGL